MKMTNRELDIIGQAYQNAYDERLENLKWIGKSQSDVCTIANTWQWFKIEKLEGRMPNEETFNLLICLAEDIDRLDDIVIDTERDRLYYLMKENPKLNKQIDLSSFAEYIETGKGTVITVLNWILDEEVKFFNYIIGEINNQTFDYISKEDWIKSPYTSFNSLKTIEVRKW